MRNITSETGYLPHELVFKVINPEPVCCDNEGALVSVKNHAGTRAFKTVRIATLALPGGPFVAEVEGGYIGIGGFLVVAVVIPPPAAGHAHRTAHFQSPACQIQDVDAIVAELAITPMPMPVPVVVDEIIL